MLEQKKQFVHNPLERLVVPLDYLADGLVYLKEVIFRRHNGLALIFVWQVVHYFIWLVCHDDFHLPLIAILEIYP